MVGLAATAAAIGVAAAAPSLAIEVKPNLVVVGGQANIIVAPGTDPSERMTIEMKTCSDTGWRTVAGARSWPDGYWTAAVHPTLNGVVRARVRQTTSEAVQVQVRPYVNLTPLGRPWFRVEVGAGRYLTGKRVFLERFVAGAWSRVASVRLARDRAAAFAFSSARFRARVAQGSRIRAVVPGTRCYLKGVSSIEVTD